MRRAILAALLFGASFSPASAAPGEVTGVRWCAGTKDCLEWDAVAGSPQYSVYRGESGSLACVINPAVDSCAYSSITTATTGRTLTLSPPEDRYEWYLVTARDVSGEGTSGVGAYGLRQLNVDGACGGSCAPVGASCSNGASCCSSNCLAGRCVVACCKASGGADCAANVDCAGGTCHDGACLPACACPHHELVSVDLLTPGVFDQFGTPVVSPEATGAFWILGGGDPASGSGIDNGGFPPGGCIDAFGCWIYFTSDVEVPDPGTHIDSDWTDERIDGCVDALPGQRCMAAMLGDQTSGTGYFTLLTAADRAADGFTFGPTQPYVELIPLPRPSITGQSDTGSKLTIDAGLEPVPSSGIVPDPACQGTVLLGYKIYRQVVGGGPAPVGRRRAEWELARGGSGLGGQPLSIGTVTTLTATGCVNLGQVYLAATLVFDSGFEVPFVSANAAPIPCGTCQSVDGDGDGFRGDKCAASSLFDCDDASPTVYPGAPQICDGLANDCNAALWPSLVGTNEQDSDDDGVSECAGDPCPHDRNDDCDQDGRCGDVDNCPEIPNPAQQDADQDGVGDACDLCPASSYNDDDDDGICGDLDNCPLVRNPSQSNADHDALGDVCDACPHDDENDADHDGRCGDVDTCPHDAENDADLDGICGDLDPCPHEPGTGCNHFGPPNVVVDALFSGITSIAAADLDGDSDVDVVATVGTAPSNTNKVLWFENAREDGSVWNSHQVSATQNQTRYVTVVDLDRDGDVDILFSSLNRVVWFENAGNGSGWAAHVIQPSTGARMIAAGDLDGDGDLDVVATDSADRVLWNENLDGHGLSWASRVLAAFHDDPQALALADVDGDDDLDVFVTGGTRFLGEKRLAVYVNLGLGASWQQRTLELAPPYAVLSIAAADIDGDTDVDLVVGADGGGSPGKAYWQENLAGNGTAWSAHLIQSSNSLQYKSVFPADLDGDDDVDVLVGRAFPPSFSWLENVGGNGAVWPFHWIAETSPSPVQLLAADLDGDSDLDAVAATSNTILWFENSP